MPVIRVMIKFMDWLLGERTDDMRRVCFACSSIYRGGSKCEECGDGEGMPLTLLSPPWVECPNCESMWCMLHSAHAFECECPAVEEWK